MAYEQRDFSGIMFVNDRKKPDSNQPDRKGTAMVDGKMYEVAGWVKQGTKGAYMTLAFKVKDAPPVERQQPKDTGQSRSPDPGAHDAGPDGGSIPF